MEDADINRVRDLLEQADAVVVAASNGFDIADGYNQFACDDDFLRMFGDLHCAYGLTSILQGLMARWSSIEDRWRFFWQGSSTTGMAPTSLRMPCRRSSP